MAGKLLLRRFIRSTVRTVWALRCVCYSCSCGSQMLSCCCDSDVEKFRVYSGTGTCTIHHVGNVRWRPPTFPVQRALATGPVTVAINDAAELRHEKKTNSKLETKPSTTSNGRGWARAAALQAASLSMLGGSRPKLALSMCAGRRPGLVTQAPTRSRGSGRMGPTRVRRCEPPSTCLRRGRY
jgi:hypothetical protein